MNNPLGVSLSKGNQVTNEVSRARESIIYHSFNSQHEAGKTAGCVYWERVSQVSVSFRVSIPEKEQKTEGKSMLMYRDVLPVLPTGYGKSLIFQAYVMAIKRATE